MSAISRLAFFGTPDFAVPTLEALVRAGWAPALVVTQPARPAGRGGKLAEPPVASWARAHGLEVAQPEKVRAASFLERMLALEPDVAVVVAFGQIFPKRLLAIPRLGCVNLHGSLLPRYRGASPIQAAIAAGEHETGVTTMQMGAGLDSGPMLMQRTITIDPDETAGALFDRLSVVGAELMVETLRGLAAGTLRGEPQDDALATFAPRIEKHHGRVDWQLPAQALYDRLRAFTPWPGLTAELRGEPLKILWARPVASTSASAEPGSVLGVEGERLLVRCGAHTALGLEQVQRAGRGVVSGAELARGLRLSAGEQLH